MQLLFKNEHSRFFPLKQKVNARKLTGFVCHKHTQGLRTTAALGSWTPELLASLGPHSLFLHPGLRSSYSKTKKPIWRTWVMGKREGHPVRSESLSSEKTGRKKFILVYKQTFDSSSHWWRRQQSTLRPLVWETKRLPQSKTSIYDLK